MNNPVSERHQPFSDALHPDLLRDFKNVENLRFIQAILNSYTHFSAIVNRHKQIILSNEHLVKLVGLQNLNQILDHRPGELFNCIHVTARGICTTTDSCRFCGINRTIHESQRLNKHVSGECRISTRVDGKLVSYDFQVTCVPLLFNNEQYTLLSLVDISSEKRNEMLEKVFFHDLMNRLGGFDGIIKIIKSENKQPELEEYIDLLNTIGELTIEDIQTQRILRAAENEDLILNISDHSAYEIIESVRKQLSFHPALNSKKIIICAECADFTFKTDGALLKRILLNMAKNAAEATPDGGSIEVICRKKPVIACFSVHNKEVIPEDIHLQIFQRSFSTKGPGRGLGTYSMKLFGENYLKGRVYFTSDEKEGTTFTIEVPFEPV
jgi:signal transduction histidine kinase